jgi:hypothetical protein
MAVGRGRRAIFAVVVLVSSIPVVAGVAAGVTGFLRQQRSVRA